jgi:hypothetical protein
MNIRLVLAAALLATATPARADFCSPPPTDFHGKRACSTIAEMEQLAPLVDQLTAALKLQEQQINAAADEAETFIAKWDEYRLCRTFFPADEIAPGEEDSCQKYLP